MTWWSLPNLPPKAIQSHSPIQKSSGNHASSSNDVIISSQSSSQAIQICSQSLNQVATMLLSPITSWSLPNLPLKQSKVVLPSPNSKCKWQSCLSKYFSFLNVRSTSPKIHIFHGLSLILICISPYYVNSSPKISIYCGPPLKWYESPPIYIYIYLVILLPKSPHGSHTFLRRVLIFPK